MSESTRGVLLGIAAYGLWGLFPLFWNAVGEAPAHELLAHRTVWSLVFLAIVLAVRREWRWLRPALADRRTRRTFLATAAIIAVNWLTYIWAVNNGRIVESSLGYFINPLLNVALGMVFLRERLRRWQAVAVGLALVGVVGITLGKGVPPWIALLLALTFGTYGLLRKTAPLGALPGLSLEVAVLTGPAVAFLAILAARGEGHFLAAGPGLSAGLALSGPVTAIPLLLFAAAARRVRLITVGLLQYIAPTLQFLIGVIVYGETLGPLELGGFVVVWIALAVYSAEGVLDARRRTRQK